MATIRTTLDQTRAASPLRLDGAAWVWAVALAVAVASVGHATVALAQTETRANALYKDAKEKFEAGDLTKALEQAQEAERLFAHPSIVFLRGRILHRLSRLREADDALKLADSPQLPKPLAKPLADERAQVADEMKRSSELKVTVQPAASAVVSVEGETSQGGYIKWLPPGKRRIEVAAPGYRPVVRVAEMNLGAPTEVRITLVPMGGSLVVVVPGGLLGVEVQVDGGTIDIADGARAGDRSPALAVSVGGHEVVCSRGPKRFQATVKVEMDATAEVVCEGVAGGGGPGRALGWGGVAVGTGIFGYGAYGLGSYLLVDLQSERKVKASNKHWLGASYATIGLATAIASYLFFVREPAAATAAVRPGQDGAVHLRLSAAADAPTHAPDGQPTE
ncbi:MAG: hypothetical protein EXR79_01230 [Myxococcales bacterium]|nr:hypothetical protein [Myxococcales bacterium]